MKLIRRVHQLRCRGESVSHQYFIFLQHFRLGASQMVSRSVVWAVFVALLFSSQLSAQEPGWWGVVIAPSNQRPLIESTPIIHRPYRPLHFYGNTVRRNYYRGTPLPAPRDFLQGGAALVVGR